MRGYPSKAPKRLFSCKRNWKCPILTPCYINMIHKHYLILLLQILYFLKKTIRTLHSTVAMCQRKEKISYGIKNLIIVVLSDKVRETSTQEQIVEGPVHICKVRGVFSKEVSLKLVSGQSIETCKERNSRITFKSE